MSYENTECPCGKKKEPNTMLCGNCMERFRDDREMEIFMSKERYEIRRYAAIRLIGMAKALNKRIDPEFIKTRR